MTKFIFILVFGVIFSVSAQLSVHEINFNGVPLPPPYSCSEKAKSALIELANKGLKYDERREYWSRAPSKDFIRKARNVITFFFDNEKQDLTVTVPILVSQYNYKTKKYHQVDIRLIQQIRTQLEADLNEAGEKLGVTFLISIENLWGTNASKDVNNGIHLHFRDPFDPVWTTLNQLDYNQGRSFVCDNINIWWLVKSKAIDELPGQAFDSLIAVTPFSNTPEFQKKFLLQYDFIAHEATHFIFGNDDAYKLSSQSELSPLNAKTCFEEDLYDRDGRLIIASDGQKKSRRYDPIEVLMFVLRYGQKYNQKKWRAYVKDPYLYEEPYSCK